MTLQDLRNTRWVGRNELWLDPRGDEAETCDATLTIGENTIEYRWSREGKEHTGSLALREGGVEFTDTFHSAKPMPLETVPGSWCLLDVKGTYTWEGSPPWGWRIYVSRRPESDELVLQMTNITPWGEDVRAVRMICRRA